jgi:hypothetical protein
MKPVRARLSLGVLALAALPLRAGAPARPAVPFIEDDYQKALDEASSRKLPVFVEAWAPW